MKRILSVICAALLLAAVLCQSAFAQKPEIGAEVSAPASAALEGPQIQAPCGILMEASTGTVLYEIGGVDEALAREAFRRAAHKLPVKCKVITKAAAEEVK